MIINLILKRSDNSYYVSVTAKSGNVCEFDLNYYPSEQQILELLRERGEE